MLDLIKTFQADPDAEIRRQDQKRTEKARQKRQRKSVQTVYTLTDGTEATARELAKDNRNVNRLSARQIQHRLVRMHLHPDKLFKPINPRGKRL